MLSIRGTVRHKEQYQAGAAATSYKYYMIPSAHMNYNDKLRWNSSESRVDVQTFGLINFLCMMESSKYNYLPRASWTRRLGP